MTSCSPKLLRANLAPHRTGVALAKRLARVEPLVEPRVVAAPAESLATA